MFIKKIDTTSKYYEMLMKGIYFNYHKHTHESNASTIDSETFPEAYMKRAKELGHTAYSTCEHRYGGRYLPAYDQCKEYNLKMVYVVEAYYVDNRLEKDNSNYHIVLIARNKKGFYEINKIVSEANRTGFYNKPRIDLELLLTLNPKNVFITTACIGGRLRDNDCVEKFIEPVLNHFKDSLFLEIQNHNAPKQIELNKKVLYIHNKFNIPLIHGCDSHYIFPEDAKYREMLIKGKQDRVYDNEGEFIEDYPDLATIIKRYINQGIVPNDKVVMALLNTNYIEDCCEDLNFTKEIKMPTIFPKLNTEQKLDKLYNILQDNFKRKISEGKIDTSRLDEYVKSIEYEFGIVRDTSEVRTVDYFLLNYYGLKKAKEEKKAIITKTGRGSAPSFYINNLLGFTDIDRLKMPIPLYPTRFMSTARILKSRSLPDIDMNCADSTPIYEAFVELLGKDNIYFMTAYGTMQESAAFRNTCRALDLDISDYEDVAKDIDKYRNDSRWKGIIELSSRYVGVIDSISPSPCSFLMLNTSISEETSVMRIGDVLCSTLDGYTCDVWKYLKNDFLTVTVYEIIGKVFEKINQPIFSIDELLLKVKNDEKVWGLFRDGITATLNQADSDYASPLIQKYAPTSLEELSAWVASIRPGFASLLNNFLNRLPYTTHEPKIDELLEASFHYMMYQENIMSYLVFLGINESESYDILKKIAKKKFTEKELEELKSELKEHYLLKIGNLDNFDELWKVIEDASRYSFNSSHSVSVALDCLYQAYLKANYPLEYYATVLEVYSDNIPKTGKITNELSYFNIKLEPISYRYSKGEYNHSKSNNAIYKGIGSIKYLNNSVGDNLYTMAGEHEFEDFIGLLQCATENGILTSRQFKILIGLNFFREFGKNKTLLIIYNKFSDRFKKTHKDKTKLVRLKEIREYAESLPQIEFTPDELARIELEYLGYSTVTCSELNYDVFILISIKSFKNKSIMKLYRLKDGETIIYKVKNTILNSEALEPLKPLDLFQALETKEDGKWGRVDGKWEKSKTEFETFLLSWKKFI